MSPDLPPPRRGRRDNGLPAATFVPLADVDPRIGEHLLDLLKLAGVPAYLEPSSDVEPYTRAVALPSPPTDRLWVDRDRRGAAREILEAEARSSGISTFPAQSMPPRSADRNDREHRPSAGLADLDEERAWEEIVAGWDEAVDTPVPPWPVQEDADPGPGPDPEGGARAALADTTPGPGSSPSQIPIVPPAGPPIPPVPVLPEDDEEHYVPPPPPPVPRPSRHTVLAIVLVLTGILVLLVPGLLGLEGITGFTVGVLGVLAGGVVLVLGLRDSRSDDGPDDGAVV